MSTPLIILRSIADAKLVEFIPDMKPRELAERGLFLTPPLYRWVMQEPKKNPARDYHANIYSQLKDFVIGEQIDDLVFMKQVRPFDANIWAIRILWQPQCRIFGAFFHHNCFIGLHKAERKKLDYEEHVKKAKKKWQEIFPSLQRITGDRFHHYVSNGKERDYGRKKYT